jgi:hypothetical protein
VDHKRGRGAGDKSARKAQSMVNVRLPRLCTVVAPDPASEAGAGGRKAEPGSGTTPERRQVRRKPRGRAVMRTPLRFVEPESGERRVSGLTSETVDNSGRKPENVVNVPLRCLRRRPVCWGSAGIGGAMVRTGRRNGAAGVEQGNAQRFHVRNGSPVRAMRAAA